MSEHRREVVATKAATTRLAALLERQMAQR
jgi:hypothetical protein